MPNPGRKISIIDHLRSPACIDIDEKTGCWNWKRTKLPAGYGMVKYMRKTWSAHRLSYEMFRAPIPPGLQIDHLCRNRSCINPDHLEPVTQKENVRRGMLLTADTIPARNIKKTHCPKGHPLSGDNVSRRPDQPNTRGCKACLRENKKKDWIENKQARQRSWRLYYEKNKEFIKAKARERYWSLQP